MPLVIELAEQGHTTEDPVLLREVRGELEGKDKVGGVAGGGQGASSLAGLVQWTDIHTFVCHLTALLYRGQGMEEGRGYITQLSLNNSTATAAATSLHTSNLMLLRSCLQLTNTRRGESPNSSQTHWA